MAIGPRGNFNLTENNGDNTQPPNKKRKLNNLKAQAINPVEPKISIDKLPEEMLDALGEYLDFDAKVALTAVNSKMKFFFDESKKKYYQHPFLRCPELKEACPTHLNTRAIAQKDYLTLAEYADFMEQSASTQWDEVRYLKSRLDDFNHKHKIHHYGHNYAILHTQTSNITKTIEKFKAVLKAKTFDELSNINGLINEINAHLMLITLDNHEKCTLNKTAMRCTKLPMTRLVVDKLEQKQRDTLKNLTSLTIEDCPIYYLTNDFMKLLSNNLTNLSIENSKLTCLPESLSVLRSLESLNLNNNKISELNPEVLMTLGNLKKISLENNQITAIPAQFFELGVVQDMSFAHNQIKEVSPEIANNLSFKNVDLSHNLIEQFPETLLTADNRLQTLNVSYNKISELPHALIETTQKSKEVTVQTEGNRQNRSCLVM